MVKSIVYITFGGGDRKRVLFLDPTTQHFNDTAPLTIYNKTDQCIYLEFASLKADWADVEIFSQLPDFVKMAPKEKLSCELTVGVLDPVTMELAEERDDREFDNVCCTYTINVFDQDPLGQSHPDPVQSESLTLEVREPRGLNGDTGLHVTLLPVDLEEGWPHYSSDSEPDEDSPPPPPPPKRQKCDWKEEEEEEEEDFFL
jgi:hypothetical protein